MACEGRKGTMLMMGWRIFSFASHVMLAVACVFILGKNYGLQGIVVSLGISLIFTTIWYYPYVLFKSLKPSKEQYKKLFYSILILVVGITLSVFLSQEIFLKNWFDLIKYTIIYSFIFIFIYYLINIDLRVEINGYIKSKFILR